MARLDWPQMYKLCTPAGAFHPLCWDGPRRPHNDVLLSGPCSSGGHVAHGQTCIVSSSSIHVSPMSSYVVLMSVFLDPACPDFPLLHWSKLRHHQRQALNQRAHDVAAPQLYEKRSFKPGCWGTHPQASSWGSGCLAARSPAHQKPIESQPSWQPPRTCSCKNPS